MINLYKIIKRCIKSKKSNNGVFFSGRESNIERNIEVKSNNIQQEHRHRVPKKMCNNSVHFSGRERNTERISATDCPKAQESHRKTEGITARPSQEVRTTKYEEGGGMKEVVISITQAKTTKEKTENQKEKNS